MDLLQRSRAPECTERRANGARRGSRAPCFNGAVHRSARKGTDAMKSARKNPSFNGAVHRSARKAACPARRAEATEPGFNGAVHRSARKAGTSRPGSGRKLGFNGAVHRSARKGQHRGGQAPDLPASTEPCTGVHGKNSSSLRPAPWAPLQRSRAPECTESLQLAYGKGPPMPASTEPCTGVHGKPDTRVTVRNAWHASTEPCTGVHGKRHAVGTL